MLDEYLTIEQAARLLQIDTFTVEHWISRGLPHTEEHGTIKIKRSDLDAFLQQEGQGRARDAATEV